MKIQSKQRPSTILRFLLVLFTALLGLAAIIGSGGGGGDTIPAFSLESGIAIGDLDQDGNPDIALAARYLAGPPPHPGTVYLFLQSEVNPGEFNLSSSYGVGNDPWGDLKIEDVDGDGVNDIVVANSQSNSISILYQDPGRPGNFFPARNYSGGVHPNSVATGDLNADNIIDVAVANANGISVLFQDPVTPGSFLSTTNIVAGFPAGSVAIADLNADGASDIAIDGDTSDIFVFFQNPFQPGEFFPPVNLPAGSYPSSVAVGDLDEDGYNDIVAANRGSPSDGSNAGVSVLIQNSASPGSFLPTKNYATTNSAQKVVVEDLNGDTHLDLAVSNTTLPSGTVSVLLQDASSPGTFFPAGSYFAGFQPYFIAAKDLDRDGLADIAVSEGPSILFQDPNTPGTFLPISIIGNLFDSSADDD